MFSSDVSARKCQNRLHSIESRRCRLFRHSTLNFQPVFTMSVLRLARNCGNFAKLFNSNSTKLTSFSSVVGKKVNFAPSQRHFSLTLVKLSEEEEEEPAREKKAKTDRDRSTKHSVETSIEYLNSDAYQTTYGGKLVWDGYIRINKRGANNKLAPRKSCIYGDAVTVASPCPVCRDEYLILDHRNIDLLKQFISPYTGRVIPMSFERATIS